MAQLEQWMLTEQERIKKRFMERELPDYMWGGVERYLLHGISPGNFLTAALENRLSGAFSYADQTNTFCMKQWVQFFYNDLPGNCWGDVERVENWIVSGGWIGRQAAADAKEG